MLQAISPSAGHAASLSGSLVLALLATLLTSSPVPAQSNQSSPSTRPQTRSTPPPPATPSILRNADIVRLTQQGMSESVILTLLQQNQTAFDTSADALIALKRAGVTDRVMTEMMIRSTAPAVALIIVLRNSDVVRMTQSKQPPGSIIEIVRQSETDFDLSAAAVADLKKQGVSDAVVAAMLSAGKTDTSAASELGSLRLRGPAGGEVFVDGVHRASIAANGETLLRDLLAGEHQIRIVVPNRPELRTTASVVGGAETVFTATAEESTAAAPPPPPAPFSNQLPAGTQTFDLVSGWGSGTLYVASGGLRFQANRGARNFAATCNDVDWKAGAFRMSLRLTVRGESRPYDFDVKDPRLDAILRTLDEVCGAK